MVSLGMKLGVTTSNLFHIAHTLILVMSYVCCADVCVVLTYVLCMHAL